MMGASKSSVWISKTPFVVILLIFCLTSTALLAQNKFDFLSYVKSIANKARAGNTTNLPWPDSHLWAKLSYSPRSPLNKCQISTCPTSTTTNNDRNKSALENPFTTGEACPFYFKYIHEDLAPWTAAKPNATTDEAQPGIVGISKDMLDGAQGMADFRLVIKNGRVYVDAYRPCFQTRAVFTVWSILQLLRYYPGLVPDVDMLFGCGDTPAVLRSAYTNTTPPPVFRYCSTAEHLDIPFPDWSFWGWPEVNLGTWEKELSEILQGDNELLWEARDPTAFWRGNTGTGGKVRQTLQGCNGEQYGAVIINQNWDEASRNHYKDSKLSHQCLNRYKIYAEGWGWSVSLKYIMGCDSPALVIDPRFFDFFSRGMMPLQHYWPIRVDGICDSIKFAVDWGNNYTVEAEFLGREGRQYIAMDVRMKYVYDYMLHLMREYAKLLRYSPSIDGMTELCIESFMCQAPENEVELYEEGMVEQASIEDPCSMGPRDESLIQSWVQRKLNITQAVRQAEMDHSPPNVAHTIMTLKRH